MIGSIIIAILALIITFIFTVFIFKNVIKRINDSAKRYFIEKLQAYNYLIDEKEEHIQTLNNQLREKENQMTRMQQTSEINEVFNSSIEEKLEEMRIFKAKMEKNKQEELVYNIPTPKFREETFFRTYKEMKQNFNVDSTKVIKEFLQKHPETKDDQIYNELKTFREQFTPKALYEMLTLSNKEQYQIVKEVISSEANKILKFESKFNKDKFTTTKLINELDELLKKYNPNIYVYVGQTDISYNKLDRRIKTKFYKNMSEGVIIYYKGKIYDYSI